MAASSLMSLGTRAMFANYTALTTVGHNISNANTPGYSRQNAEFETSGGQFTGAGYYGRGVNVTTISRAHDSFLTKEAALTRSLAASDSARLSQLQQLEKVFQTGESGLGYAAGQLLNSFVDVASRPADISARQVVLARTEEVASRFRAASEQLNVLQNGVTQDLRNAIDRVNDLARQVATINARITEATGAGHSPNDLLDQRDQLVSEISEYVQVSSIFAEDGSQNLFIGGGQMLVLGAQTATLVGLRDDYNPAMLRVGVQDQAGTRTLPPDILVAGSIAGLLRFQDQDLRDARNLVGQMATALAYAVNEQQALGYNLGNPPSAGSPLFNVGAPRVAASTTNSGNAAFTIGVANAMELRASDYELRFDGTQYTLTRLSDNQPVNGSPFSAADMATGVEVDGFSLRMASGTANPGDRFQLQPVAAASSGMTRALDNPKGIAAASPVSATVGVDNRGTASIASIRATTTTPNPPLGPNDSMTLRFTSDTEFAIELVSGTPPSSTVIGTGTWTPGQPIRLSDSAGLDGWELTLNGVPRGPETVNGQTLPGDTLTIEPTRFPESNNHNALSLVDLATQRIVGQQTLADGTVVPGVTMTDAYANAMATIGLRVQTAKSASQMSQAVADNAEAQRANSSGVNLDEEAARLMQFQQSYQAAAKMLQVAQSIFDTLLRAANP